MTGSHSRGACSACDALRARSQRASSWSSADFWESYTASSDCRDTTHATNGSRPPATSRSGVSRRKRDMSTLGDLYQPPEPKVRNMQAWRERRQLQREREAVQPGALRANHRMMWAPSPPPARTCQWLLARTAYPEVAVFCDAPSMPGRSYCCAHAARVFLLSDEASPRSDGVALTGETQDGHCRERTRIDDPKIPVASNQPAMRADG